MVMIFRSFLGHTSGLNIGIVKVEFFHCSEWFDPICQRCCKGRATSWSIRIWNDGLIQELKIQILKIRNNVEHGFLRLQVTSCVLIWVVVINYGKIKNDIGAMSSSVEGRKRNRTALLFGLMAAPNLGLLASFDTRRSPELHLVRCAICSLYAAADTALKRWPTALRHPLLPTLHCLPVLCQVRLRAPPPPRPCHQGTSFVLALSSQTQTPYHPSPQERCVAASEGCVRVLLRDREPTRPRTLPQGARHLTARHRTPKNV